MKKETKRFAQFRWRLYDKLGCRADRKMELLDALCSDHRAQSVVELSLTPAFRAHYSIGLLTKRQ